MLWGSPRSTRVRNLTIKRLIAKGDEILDFAVYEFPEFNNFNRWAAHLDDARESATTRRHSTRSGRTSTRALARSSTAPIRT
jgi:hypothetical protein